MTHIDETRLPGVGTRYAFETEEGRMLGVVHHHTGRREVFVGDPGDPDCVALSVNLTESEGHVLADLLGGSSLAQHVGELEHHVHGLSIDWVTIPPDWPVAGSLIGDLRIRTRTGAYIVAVVRDGAPDPAPGPDHRLEAGDVLVVIGTVDGLKAFNDLLERGI
jgi:TrkA domain protein